MKWGLIITSLASRGLRRASRHDRARINDVFSELCVEPYAGDFKQLRGTDRGYRRRVGDWRILFDLDTERRFVVVLAVKRRDSKTY
jgi:mRNA interferase RelE/StbE